MFYDYKMLRNSGISPVGAAFMSAYLFVIVGPMMSNLYDRSYVSEQIDDFGPPNNLIDCPPMGSSEWDDWVENQPGSE